MTESPVVVHPLTASNRACTQVSCPLKTKGSAPKRMPQPHAKSTVKLLRITEERHSSFGSLSFFRRQTARPASSEAAEGKRKDHANTRS
ncbi:hypothetical protein SDC9_112238 [bioreactor metagenome]|uniref:Uncharacterized protein n=1 Tax=bioreactor metagenome TaxID=1076179 RepID=A0A645BQ44_9ZZZZ